MEYNKSWDLYEQHQQGKHNEEYALGCSTCFDDLLDALADTEVEVWRLNALVGGITDHVNNRDDHPDDRWWEELYRLLSEGRSEP